MTPEVARITARWREFGACFRADEAQRREALGVMLDAYSGAGRHYHDIGHIDSLLELSRAHRAALADPLAVDLAILYHDAVYEPSRTDNEAASAALAPPPTPMCRDGQVHDPQRALLVGGSPSLDPR